MANVPWRGLPDDLWERGHSAKIGQRFVGDVAGVMAEILATDARAAADAAVSSVNLATWDALRYLAARVELLEGRIDPLGFETAEWPMELPDPGEWLEAIETWLGPCGCGARWFWWGSPETGAWWAPCAGPVDRWWGWSRGERRCGAQWTPLVPAGEAGPTVVFSEVLPYLTTVPRRRCRCRHPAGLFRPAGPGGQGQTGRAAVRAVRPGGTIVVLATDGAVWERALSIPERDLAPGRPLHPETWSLLLRRAGAVDPRWHAAESGALHAVVAKVRS